MIVWLPSWTKILVQQIKIILTCITGLFGSVRDTGLSYETLVTLYSLLTALPDYKDGDKLLSTLVKVARNGDKVVKKISSSLPLRDNVALIRGLNRLAGIVPQKKITKVIPNNQHIYLNRMMSCPLPMPCFPRSNMTITLPH